jgi:hypothetical protein
MFHRHFINVFLYVLLFLTLNFSSLVAFLGFILSEVIGCDSYILFRGFYSGFGFIIFV